MKRTDRAARNSGRSMFRWLIFAFFGLLGTVVIIGGIAAFAFYLQLNRSLPSAQALKDYHPPLVSTLYASDGSLIGEFYTERRYLVPLERVPSHLLKAFLAAEDARFYEHGGVD